MIGGTFQRARRNLGLIAQDPDVSSASFVALAWLLEGVVRRVPEHVGVGPLCTTTPDHAVGMELHREGCDIVAVYDEETRLWKVRVSRGIRGTSSKTSTAHFSSGDLPHAVNVFVNEMGGQP